MTVVEVPTPAEGSFVTLPPRVSGPAVAATRPGIARRVTVLLPPYLYLLPALAGIVAWTYRPLLQTAQLSFYEWNLIPTTPMVPVGAANYRAILALPEMWQAIQITVWYLLALLPFTIVIPTVTALLTQRIGGRSRVVYRALIFIPTLAAPVAAAAVWQWLLYPSGGAVNRVLEVFGVNGPNWLRNTATAPIAIIGITGWQLLGFAVLVVTAGLTAIDPDYGGAAALDGASRWQITRWITLPLLSPSLLFMVLMTLLLSAQWMFPLIDVLTQGGPGGATTNLYYLLWQFGFRDFNAGMGAAAGVIFFVGFGVVALVFVRLTDQLTFHDN